MLTDIFVHANELDKSEVLKMHAVTWIYLSMICDLFAESYDSLQTENITATVFTIHNGKNTDMTHF